MTRPERPGTPPRPWGSYTIPDDDTFSLRIGPRDLWLTARDGEIWLSHAAVPQDERRSRPPDEPADDLGWRRWAAPRGTQGIEILPVLPDRAVVVEPERDFHLVSGARARVFVRVPLSIRIQLRGDRPELLDEVPTLTMSDTWWGSFTEGELCYWLPTTARRRIKPELLEPHLAICPLEMSNHSDRDLHVEKLTLRVVYLSLFSDGKGLWADEARVRYQDDAEGSQIDLSGAAPPEAAGSRLVSPPRVPAPRGFRARTFTRLWALSGTATNP